MISRYFVLKEIYLYLRLTFKMFPTQRLNYSEYGCSNAEVLYFRYTSFFFS